MSNGSLRTALLYLLFAASTLVTSAFAANDNSSMQALKGELLQMQRQFIALQRSTIEKHETLEADQKSLQALTAEKLAEAGFDSDAKARIKTLKSKLQDPATSEEDKQATKQEMGELARSFKSARMAIAKDQELLAAKQSFQQKLINTMKEEHPKLPQLLQAMQVKSQKLQQQISQSAESAKGSAAPQ
ncbi:hypothetical protein GP5015_2506 [gamma proteobacterium HTCC5015]|nr:hypothetical protein GP5015_2506 [gamma proteobacterium HTCC5015]